MLRNLGVEVPAPFLVGHVDAISAASQPCVYACKGGSRLGVAVRIHRRCGLAALRCAVWFCCAVVVFM